MTEKIINLETVRNKLLEQQQQQQQQREKPHPQITEAKEIFEEAIQNNKKHQERLKKERAEHNKQVKRAFRIKDN